MKRITAGGRAVLCLVCSVLLLHCLQASARAQPRVTTDKTTYVRGEAIRVDFFGAPGISGDWICIVHAGASDTTAGDYQYMPVGRRHGRLIFRASRPGHYEVRAYYNYRRNGYVVSARHAFTVVDRSSYGKSKDRDEYPKGHQPLVSTDKTKYFQGQKIWVRFAGAPGLSGDWICIVHAGAPATDAGNYQYLPNGERHGHLIFRAPGPGSYEVRAFYDYRHNGYAISARYRFTVIRQDQYSGQGANTPDPRLEQAQYILKKRGYDPGDIDGMYGRKTRMALRRFQRDNHLKPTGRLDGKTLKALGLAGSAPV